MERIGFYGPQAERAAAQEIQRRRASGARVLAYRPEQSGDGALASGAREFVASHGALWSSQAFWLEWATDAALEALPPAEGAADLLVVASAEPRAELVDRWRDTAGLVIPQDRFGRPGVDEKPMGSAPVRIAILGDEAHHRHASPAPLARLGDAADRLALDVCPVFITADTLRSRGLPEDIAGAILPGGSDMDQVSAQVKAASLLLDDGRPAFGLCLGMQSQVTALMRRGGWPDAMPEEVVGLGPQRSFIRLRDVDATPLHRLGDTRFTPQAGSRLAALLPPDTAVRMNHRYRLNPDYPTAQSNLAVFHINAANGVADAVEVSAHPFFIGLQGHPEFGPGSGLARLWDAFLQACAQRT